MSETTRFLKKHPFAISPKIEKIEDGFSARWCEAERISRRSFGVNQRRHVANALRNPGWPCHIATVRVSGRKPLFKFANYLMIGQSRTRPLQFSTASRFPITSAKFSCRRDVIALAPRNGHQTFKRIIFTFVRISEL